MAISDSPDLEREQQANLADSMLNLRCDFEPAWAVDAFASDQLVQRDYDYTVRTDDRWMKRSASSRELPEVERESTGGAA